MRRVRRWLPIFAGVALLGFSMALAGEAGMARASGQSLVSAELSQPYRDGPLDRRERSADPDWPSGSRELLALSVISAILYGFHASGLARNKPARRGMEATQRTPRLWR